MTRKTPENKLRQRSVSVGDEFAARLYGLLLLRLRNKEDAQDLAQEAYLRLLRVERKKIIEKPESYLFRIATNLANEFAMQQRAAPTIIDIDETVEANVIGDGDSFEKGLEHRAELRRLEAILEKMPPAYRAVLILSKRDGLSRDEISRELGLSIHTVKKYLARAAAWCREEMSE